MLHIPGLYIGPSENRDRGIFTSEALQTGDLIEICPVIVLPHYDVEHIDKTKIYDYYFIWNEKYGTIAIILGYGSLYNHSATPNAEVSIDQPNRQIHITANAPINAHSEIFFDYTGEQSREIELWFDVV